MSDVIEVGDRVQGYNTHSIWDAIQGEVVALTDHPRYPIEVLWDGQVIACPMSVFELQKIHDTEESSNG